MGRFDSRWALRVAVTRVAVTGIPVAAVAVTIAAVAVAVTVAIATGETATREAPAAVAAEHGHVAVAIAAAEHRLATARVAAGEGTAAREATTGAAAALIVHAGAHRHVEGAGHRIAGQLAATRPQGHAGLAAEILRVAVAPVAARPLIGGAVAAIAVAIARAGRAGGARAHPDVAAIRTGRGVAVGRDVGLGLDKGKGAVIVTETESRDAESDALLFKTRSSMFIRGAGGFGGDRGPSGPKNEPPGRAPDHEVTYQTSVDQALLYRLSGDRNPLHSDPEFAKMARFPKPILHGLCTYGFTGRALLHTLCESDPARFKSMEGRFSKPVFPGEALTVKMWVDGTQCLFQTVNPSGEVVLDQGLMTFG